MHSRNMIRIATATALILLIPLLVMRPSDGAGWSVADFILAGAIIFGAGLTYEFVSTKMKGGAYKLAIGLAVVTALILTWVNLAVGIIGSEDDPVNPLYSAVLALGFIGAIIADFEPRKMARVLFAMAIAQMSIPIIAFVWRRPDFSLGVIGVSVFNLIFAAMFGASALLFRAASRTHMKSKQ